MKLFNSKKKEKERTLLEEIEELSSQEDAEYFKTHLTHKKNVYDFEKYLQLLECVRDLLKAGLGKRNSVETIMKTARIKML